MGKQGADIGICEVCKNPVPFGRTKHGGKYCSAFCEKKIYGYSPQHLKEIIRMGGKISPEVNASTAFTPMPLEPIVNINADRVLIMSDLHCPLHDAIWATRAIDAGLHFGCKDLILNGDVMDLNSVLSKHSGSYYRRHQELEDDMSAAEVLVEHLCKKFERVYWVSGNHDVDRLVRIFKGELQAQRLLKMVGDQGNLKITVRSYMDVNSVIRVCHPRQYSRIRGSHPQKLAQRWQRSIVCGHLHHSASTASPCGKFQAIDLPGLQKMDLQDYLRNELNDMPEPMNGFGIIFKDKVQVFDKFTPWEMWGMPPL